MEPGHWKFLGGGGLKSQNFRSKVGSSIGISWGQGGTKQKTFHGGSMDIFWNCTM